MLNTKRFKVGRQYWKIGQAVQVVLPESHPWYRVWNGKHGIVAGKRSNSQVIVHHFSADGRLAHTLPWSPSVIVR